MVSFLRHRAGELIEERYEIQRELGSGAFGTVYLCRDSELDTLAAVKELHVLIEAAPTAALSAREQALQQFRREAIHLSQLRHPHIVSGHYEREAGIWLACPICGYTFKGSPRCEDHQAAPIVVRQRHYLVMEYLDGADLGQAAARAGGSLPVDDSLKYVRQAAEALQLIHTRGFVHRDIKPENIRLRARSNDAVVLDFGIATPTGEAGDFSTRTHRHTAGGGTLGYAPESPTERRHPDARSDVHALGMTLYRLLSGCDPTDPKDLHALRRLSPREHNPAIPPDLELLIKSSISSEPSERPADAAQFLARLIPIIHPPPPLQADYHPHSALPGFSFRSGKTAHDLRNWWPCSKLTLTRHAITYMAVKSLRGWGNSGGPIWRSARATSWPISRTQAAGFGGVAPIQRAATAALSGNSARSSRLWPNRT